MQFQWMSSTGLRLLLGIILTLGSAQCTTPSNEMSTSDVHATSSATESTTNSTSSSTTNSTTNSTTSSTTNSITGNEPITSSIAYTTANSRPTAESAVSGIPASSTMLWSSTSSNGSSTTGNHSATSLDVQSKATTSMDAETTQTDSGTSATFSPSADVGVVSTVSPTEKSISITKSGSTSNTMTRGRPSETSNITTSNATTNEITKAVTSIKTANSKTVGVTSEMSVRAIGEEDQSTTGASAGPPSIMLRPSEPPEPAPAEKSERRDPLSDGIKALIGIVVCLVIIAIIIVVVYYYKRQRNSSYGRLDDSNVTIENSVYDVEL